MPKITQEEGQKRRTFALENWRKNPKLSVPKMNDLINKRFEGRMNAQHLYAIRNEVWTSLDLDAKGNAKSKSKSKPKAKAKPGNGVAEAVLQAAEAHRPQSQTRPVEVATLITLDHPTQGEFLQTVIGKLRSDGLCDLNVEITPKYAIVEKAAS